MSQRDGFPRAGLSLRDGAAPARPPWVATSRRPVGPVGGEKSTELDPKRSTSVAREVGATCREKAVQEDWSAESIEIGDGLSWGGAGLWSHGGRGCRCNLPPPGGEDWCRQPPSLSLRLAAMSRYSPRTYVHTYGGITPKVKRERYALDEFCKRMRLRHNASYRSIRIAEALRRELVVNVDGSTVDGVLRTSRGPVAVELLGYSPLEDRGDVMGRDVALRKRIKTSLYERLRTQRFSMWLGYREERRSGSERGVVRTVPREKDFGAVIQELRKVLKHVPQLEFNRFLSVRFVPREVVEELRPRLGEMYLDQARFPVCAAHFSLVRFQGSKDYLPTNVDSDLSGGYLGLNEGWVRQSVAKKATKSLHKSRERANGLPLWLIIHSDGHANHQTIHETHRSRAVELCREVLAAQEHVFARAYWADRTAFVDVAWVGRVL